MATEEVTGALELVDHGLGPRPPVALAVVDVVLHRPSEVAEAIDDGLRLDRRHHVVVAALEDEQGRGDALGEVDRRPLAVAIDGRRQRADDRVDVVALEPVRRLVEVQQVGHAVERRHPAANSSGSRASRR